MREQVWRGGEPWERVVSEEEGGPGLWLQAVQVSHSQLTVPGEPQTEDLKGCVSVDRGDTTGLH